MSRDRSSRTSSDGTALLFSFKSIDRLEGGASVNKLADKKASRVTHCSIAEEGLGKEHELEQVLEGVITILSFWYHFANWIAKCAEQSRISESTSQGLRFSKFPIVYSLSIKSLYVIILGGNCAENENQM